MNVTFADLLTPAGVLIAAGFVTTAVGILKTVPLLDRNVSGALLATLVSLVLYLATGAVLRGGGPDTFLAVAFAWVTCAASAIGIKAAAIHVDNARNGVAGIAPEIKPASHNDEDESDAVEAAVAADGTAETLPTEDPA